MGELPIFTAHAHVFTIDPKTKKTWIPSSSKAVEINYFFDPTKNCFRIVSIEDTNNGKQVIINSTLTEKMVFKKTSQKFGQWTDSKQCTIFGLGFNSEDDLDKFVDKFKSCIETMRSKSAQNPNENSNNKDSNKRELLGLNNNIVGISSSGRQWSNLTSTSPNLNNNSKVVSLEVELERLNKRMEEMKIQHQEEIKRLKDELEHTNNGALANTVDNFKNTKDMKIRMFELENENKELKRKLKELNESKTMSQISNLLGFHQQMESSIKQLSNIHFVIGQKLSDIIASQPSDVKPPTAYGL